MIDFSLNDQEQQTQQGAHMLSEQMFRPISRKYDSYDHEHDHKPELKQVAQLLGMMRAQQSTGAPQSTGNGHAGEAVRKQGFRGMATILGVEEFCWGDVGLTLAIPGRGLGNAAISAVGTAEQKARFDGLYCAMAITEPGAGSDTASITTTAERDESANEWILNGEKIFITGGAFCDAIVVWATLDRTLGRPAIKSFVVEKDRPGCSVVKQEKKLGIRASDTAAVKLDNCRIPYDNLLGDPEIHPERGFTGVMQTFDNTRPMVAAQALGVARAALEFTREKLEAEGITFPYDQPAHALTALQRDVLDMEAHLDAARLLTWRAAAMGDQGLRNSLQASMAKAKAGRAATLVTQKCVELLGPLGYSTEWLAEKWMRDSKITDLFEGTGQIQMLIIARNILGYSRDQLK